MGYLLFVCTGKILTETAETEIYTLLADSLHFSVEQCFVSHPSSMERQRQISDSCLWALS